MCITMCICTMCTMCMWIVYIHILKKNECIKVNECRPCKQNSPKCTQAWIYKTKLLKFDKAEQSTQCSW